MTLNSFFLHGSKGEQGLVQNLINEQIRMYGLEVTYIPRKYIKTDNIIKEVQSSSFKESFPIEAYMNNYEGYGSGMDIMTKFGIRLKNEISLTISRERFESYIAPLMNGIISSGNTFEGDLLFSTRPKEGDLIYFPLGERLFEIKHVEFENPFYQLGKNYVYELKCELFEYEDEEIKTNIPELQERLSEKGYITTLTLVSLGSTATAQASISPTGVVNRIYLNNDGFGYTSTPSISIEEPPNGGLRATAVAITSSIGGSFRAIKEILLTNAGYGYTTPPNITITGGGGSGAAATCSIGNRGVYKIDVIDGGEHYYTKPTVTVSSPIGAGAAATAILDYSAGNGISSIDLISGGEFYSRNPIVTIEEAPPGEITATAVASVTAGIVTSITIVNPGRGYTQPPLVSIANTIGDKGGSPSVRTIARANISAGGTVSSVYISNTGFGYLSNPTVTISSPPMVGFGTYKIGETVIGQTSNTSAVVKKWINSSAGLEKTLEVSITNGEFLPGEVIVGTESSAQYSVKVYDDNYKYDKYNQNEDFQIEGEEILDTTENNPFGFY